MTAYTLLFSPELVVEGDPSSGVLLLPVIVAANGDIFAMKKSVKTAKQAFMFNDGFTLAQFIEKEGGFEGVKTALAAREDAAQSKLDPGGDTIAAIKRADTVAATVEDGVVAPMTEQEENDLLDAIDDDPLSEQDEADLSAGLGKDD